jgi:hypothetical protein
MKKIRINRVGISFIMLLLFTGCDKVKNLLDVTFTTDRVEITFTVNPSAAGAFSSTQEVVQSDLNQQISDNGGSTGDLKSVELDTCSLLVVTPERNLNPFQSLEVWVQATGEAEKKIAWVENIPENVTSVVLSLSSDDIKSLLDKDQYTVTVKGVLDSALETAIDLKAVVKYNVVVGPK